MSFRRRTNEALAQLQQPGRRPRRRRRSRLCPPLLAESSFDAPHPGTSLADLSDMVRTWPVGWTGSTSGSSATTSWLSLRLEELTAQFSNQLTRDRQRARRPVTSRWPASSRRRSSASRSWRPRPPPVDGQRRRTALVEELRSNQIRIANDLARHEIAFRQDLAALAELVNRSRRAAELSGRPGTAELRAGGGVRRASRGGGVRRVDAGVDPRTAPRPG